MKILFLLVARGNSKGIKKKNLSIIGGKSLIALKTIAASKSKHCEEIIISTDNEEIAHEAELYGAKCLFKRPSKLARDNSATVDVIEHAIHTLEGKFKKSYDAILLLEPSSPFTRPEDYDKAIEIMIKEKYDLVVSVVEHKLDPKVIATLGVKNSLDKIITKLGSNLNLNRQTMGKNYTPNGCLYLFTAEHFTKHSRIYAVPSKSFGYVMPEEYSVEIDEPIDLEWAIFLYKKGYIKSKYWET